MLPLLSPLNDCCDVLCPKDVSRDEDAEKPEGMNHLHTLTIYVKKVSGLVQDPGEDGGGVRDGAEVLTRFKASKEAV